MSKATLYKPYSPQLDKWRTLSSQWRGVSLESANDQYQRKGVRKKAERRKRLKSKRVKSTWKEVGGDREKIVWRKGLKPPLRLLTGKLVLCHEIRVTVRDVIHGSQVLRKLALILISILVSCSFIGNPSNLVSTSEKQIVSSMLRQLSIWMLGWRNVLT